MAFNQSIRPHSWVVKSIAKPGIEPWQLKPFEFGIFDYDTNKSIGATTFNRHPKVFFALGSPNEVRKVNSGKFKNFANKDNVDLSYRSMPFMGRDFNGARIEKPAKHLRGFVKYLGYDGLNDCKSLDFECGETYEIFIRAYGSGLAMVYPNGITDVITLKMPDCDKCSDDCFKKNLCSTVIDEAILKFKNSLVAPMISVEKVISCCPAEVLTKTLFKEYCLEVCDTGNELALAEVQNQFPDVKVKRVSRKGTISTYKFCQLASLPAPAPFVQTKSVMAECDICPSGYTAVPKTRLLEVTIDNSGVGTTAAQWLTEVQTVIPTATQAERIDFSNGTSKYIVSVPFATVITLPLADTTVTEIGDVAAYCTGTPVSITWTECGDKYKVKRTLCMDIENPDCTNNAPELVAITAALDGKYDVVTGSISLVKSGDCRSQYTLEQWNNECLEDGCDTIAVAEFNPVPSYKGHAWTVCPCEGWTVSPLGCPVPPVTEDKDCRCGLRFEAAFFDRSTKTCLFDPCQAFEFEPIRFEISVSRQLAPGHASTIEHVKVDITDGPEPAFPRMRGVNVLKDVMQSRYYQDEHWIHPDVNWRMYAQNNYKYGVDLDSFYFGLYISANAHPHWRDNTMDLGARQEVALFFDEADYSLLLQAKTLVDAYLTSNGINLPITSI